MINYLVSSKHWLRVNLIAKRILNISALLVAFIILSLAVIVPSVSAETTTQITNNNYNDDSPQIDNGKVVWSGGSERGGKIFLYDIATGTTTQISNNGQSPQIDNGKIAWVGSDGNDNEIFLYDIVTGTTTQITNNDYNDSLPRIKDGKVV